MAGYLRRYIKNFAETVVHITELTKKEIPEANLLRHWTDVHQKEFEQLKSALTSTPVLAHPDFTRPFVIEVDASDYAVGAMLAQPYTDEQNRTVHRPIAYISAKLNSAQRNYDATNREGLGCVWAVDKFEHYLRRYPVTIITDHNPLTTMQTRKHCATRIERWRQRLQEFSPIWEYRKGSLHHAGDTLSRLDRTDVQPTLTHDHDRIGIFNINVTKGDSDNPLQSASHPPLTDPFIQFWTDRDTKANWIKAQGEDEVLGPIQAFVLRGKTPATSQTAYLTRATDFAILNDGLLYRITPKGKFARQALTVPKCYRDAVLSIVHNRADHGSHFGVKKVYPTMASTLWWPNMYDSLVRWTMDCMVCQRTRQGANGPIKQVGTDLVPNHPTDIMSVDTIALPRTDNSDKALVVIDHFSRFVWAFAVSDIQANTVKDVLTIRVFNQFGWPRILLTDSGTEFRNHTLSQACNVMSTKSRYVSIKHPQGNTLVERHNRTLIKQLTATCIGNSTNWPMAISESTRAYNTSALPDLNITPYELMFGRKARSVIDEALDISPVEALTPEDSTEVQKTDIQTVITKRDQRLTRARSKVNEDNRARIPIFNTGELVWTHNTAKEDAAGRNRDFKLDPTWVGPYVIVELKTNTVSFAIRPLGGREEVTLHASHLKHLLDDKGKVIKLLPTETRTPTEEIATNQPKRIAPRQSQRVTGKQFEVEQVVSHRWTSKGSLEFLIAWKGYAKNTWSTELQLSCPLLVRQYIFSLARASAIGKSGARAE